ncbi:MAG: hypothetical protein JWM64_1758, partial [Frankiales bacterium]|nr:hypothetical protein [Frankiales bacterium]
DSGSTDGAPLDVPAATAPDAGPAPATAEEVGPPGEVVQAGAAREALTLDPAVFYLALVLGGVLLLGGTQLIRFFGVKVVWS